MRAIFQYVRENLSALVIDDDPQVRSLITHILKSQNWEVYEAATADEAFNLLNEQKWALVICDVVLDGINGYEVLQRFNEEQPGTRFVLMTGHSSAAGALDATAIGAYDYLVKPFTVEDILNLSQTIHEQRIMRSQSDFAAAKSAKGYTSDIPLIGRSPAFVECMKMVGRVAGTPLPVLITGESGTGKEVVARAIHQRSPRAKAPFVAVNCGALPIELIESELFGHSKGAFTGADKERRGLWEEADGGTILLDEITETSPKFQVKLLRALQEGEIRRVGTNQIIKVDVRVIAASNRSIEEEVREGRFRRDLMYRLNAIAIHLPPLRERTEDIPLLIEHFVSKFNQSGQPIKFSAAAVELLKSYHWEGNVRELENTVLHACSLSDQTVYPEHLPERVRNFTAKQFRSEETAANADSLTTRQQTEWLPLDEMEARYVAQVLEHTNGNKQAAARILQIDRKTLTRIINRLNQKT